MTSLEFEQAHQPRNDGSLIVSLAGLAISAAKASVSGLGRWHKQRRDRAGLLHQLATLPPSRRCSARMSGSTAISASIAATWNGLPACR